jgi:type II secretory pathway component PulJ
MEFDCAGSESIRYAIEKPKAHLQLAYQQLKKDNMRAADVLTKATYRQRRFLFCSKADATDGSCILGAGLTSQYDADRIQAQNRNISLALWTYMVKIPA